MQAAASDCTSPPRPRVRAPGPAQAEAAAGTSVRFSVPEDDERETDVEPDAEPPGGSASVFCLAPAAAAIAAISGEAQFHAVAPKQPAAQSIPPAETSGDAGGGATGAAAAVDAAVAAPLRPASPDAGVLLAPSAEPMRPPGDAARPLPHQGGPAAAGPADDVPATISTQNLGDMRRFDIRLEPAELGRIDVAVSVEADGVLRAHWVVERPSTLHQLTQDAPDLAAALAQAGAQTGEGSMSFSLRQRSGGDEPEPRAPSVQDSADASTCGAPPDGRAVLTRRAKSLDLTL